MWDYYSNYDSYYPFDVQIDSKGDIKIVGTFENNNNMEEVLIQDINNALYVNEFELMKRKDNDLLLIRFVNSLFENDSRISNFNVEIITEDINKIIKITFNSNQFLNFLI